MPVRTALMAWNRFLHAGSIVSLADTCCGYGTVRSLPQGASGFTTIELKSNFLGTALDGIIVCTAKPLHQGRSTQGMGRARTARRIRERDGAFPLHPDDPLAQGVNHETRSEFRSAHATKKLLREGRSGALATLMAGSGDPYCSLVDVATAATARRFC